MAVTAVVNQKGGVGKTTVVLGLAAAAAARGRRVLVVDLDPQANATTGLGVWNPASTIADALDTDATGSIGAVVEPAGWPEGDGPIPHVAPSSARLAQSEHQMATDLIGAQDRLAAALEGVAGSYDDVLIDCPPSLGLLTVNALFAADRILIVAEPSAWSLDGVQQILRNVERIAERRNGRPSVAGIVVSRLARTRDASYWHGQLTETYPDLVLEPPVRLRAAVTEAAAQSVPVGSLTRDGAAAAALEFDALSRLVAPTTATATTTATSPPPQAPVPVPAPAQAAVPGTSVQTDDVELSPAGDH